MQQLIVRSLSGIVYVVLVLFSIFNGPFGPFFLVLLLGSVALFEWINFGRRAPNTRRLTLLYGIYFISLLAFSGPLFFAASTLGAARFLLIVLVIALFMSETFLGRQIQLQQLMHEVFGLVYLAIPLALMYRIPFLNEKMGTWYLFSLFALLWLADTCAYLVGSRWGRHKMSPEISPNKSWEGLMGALLAVWIGAAVLSWQFAERPWWFWFGLATVVLLFGVLGDLFESAVKRSFNLKDSGKFMPGHGGILDRVDSLLFAAPAAYGYLRLMEMYTG